MNEHLFKNKNEKGLIITFNQIHQRNGEAQMLHDKAKKSIQSSKSETQINKNISEEI